MRYLLKNSDYEDIFKHIEEDSDMSQEVISEDIAFSFAKALIDNTLINSRSKVIVFAGNSFRGLIGADISRILSYKGIGALVCICISEDCSDNVSAEHTGHTDSGDWKHVDSTVIMKHVKSAESFGCTIYKGIPDEIENMDFDIAIDALSGFSTSSGGDAIYDCSKFSGGDAFSENASAVINKMKCKKISLFIPYGVDPDSAEVSNRSVCADMTISTNIGRNALFMYPGCTNCGKIVFSGTCLDNKKSRDIENKITVLESSSDVTMPSRDPSGNKGTFGKLLIIAGHRNVSGAAILSCRSAYRSGCGMVKLLTTESNRVIVQESVPEVILDTYQDDEEIMSCAAHTDVDVNADVDINADEADTIFISLENDISWADRILIGPGLGTGKTAVQLVRAISEISDKPIVFDADALNIISADDHIRKNITENSNDHITITPHMGELSRLLGGTTVENIKKDWISNVRGLSDELGVTVISKDARTLIISSGSDEFYLNVRGDSGLATAGSGDVLAGIVAALSSKKVEPWMSAAKAVLFHAEAGERASAKRGETAVIAGDIIEELQEIS